ncbi:rab11 family-interacting 4 isoform X2 [Pelobates cultripes]|uniref:Rab11 family-interacting 4 isoform X2 n=1 Tax=Pelobates cultripes TaxID=61616 RepID=A0AAD1W713_PELCU|nr:rab11 family-interacting 4 isoform X2 [Pelobates cultripes]
METGGFNIWDQQHLLRFLKKLKEVFDVCDEDEDGFIKVEHFIGLGSQFSQEDEVEKLAKYLDPNDLGKINFKQFCHGVLAIKGCDELVKGVLGVSRRATPDYQTEYGGYYYQVRKSKNVLGQMSTNLCIVHLAITEQILMGKHSQNITLC